MSLWSALFLGLVQGFTEFLPVSSSAHLCLAQLLLPDLRETEDLLTFDILLHLATLAAVLAAYWRELKTIAAPAERGGRGRRLRLLPLLILASLPLLPAALARDRVEALGRSPLFLGLMLLCTGALLKLSDRLSPGGKTEETASPGDALAVGAMQALSVLPGLSRSGSTITLGLARGFSREFAVRFSFLLSVPAVLGAVCVKLPQALGGGLDPRLLPACAAGMAAAAASGFLSIRAVRALTRRGSLGRFSWYCWGLGLLSILLSILLKG